MVRLLHRELSPLPICQCFSPLPTENRRITSGKNGRACFLTFPCHHRRQLPEAEGFSAALIVATKHQLLRNTDCTWYKAQFFRFFLIRAFCFSHVILCFFRFCPIYLFGLLISPPSSPGTPL